MAYIKFEIFCYRKNERNYPSSESSYRKAVIVNDMKHSHVGLWLFNYTTTNFEANNGQDSLGEVLELRNMSYIYTSS